METQRAWHVELALEIVGGGGAFVAGQRQRCDGVRRALDVLDGGAAMRVDGLVRQHGRVEVFGIHEERRIHAHLAQIALEQLQIPGIDPARKNVELAVGRRLGRGDGLDDG